MRTRRALAALTLAPLLTACGGDPPRPAPSAPAPDTQIVRLTADGARAFTPSAITVHPGKVRIVLTTSGGMAHEFVSPTLGVNSGRIAAGESATLDFNAPKPGEYQFYCAYHQTPAMTGTITVKA
ncbi:cupredoxin domain-containing protein [Dactylosporangium sp. CA-233914]|uniref:cupredoxin domain-containing protein n=1 Tax=Dactylosporangium sp. CA-233914 TaxID=3239934 RepID=UPI003D8F72CE